MNANKMLHHAIVLTASAGVGAGAGYAVGFIIWFIGG